MLFFLVVSNAGDDLSQWVGADCVLLSFFLGSLRNRTEIPPPRGGAGCVFLSFFLGAMESSLHSRQCLGAGCIFWAVAATEEVLAVAGGMECERLRDSHSPHTDPAGRHLLDGGRCGVDCEGSPFVVFGAGRSGCLLWAAVVVCLGGSTLPVPPVPRPAESGWVSFSGWWSLWGSCWRRPLRGSG